MVGDRAGDLDQQPPGLSKLHVFAIAARRAGPHLIEATIIPAVLFYVCLVMAGVVQRSCRHWRGRTALSVAACCATGRCPRSS